MLLRRAVGGCERARATVLIYEDSQNGNRNHRRLGIKKQRAAAVSPDVAVSARIEGLAATVDGEHGGEV